MKVRAQVKVVLFSAALFLGGAAQALAGEARPTVGEAFHSQTRHTRMEILMSVLKPKPKFPGRFKSYPGAGKVKLPKPDLKGMPLGETLLKRRSIRNYGKKPISIQELSQLLFAASGKTGSSFGLPLRTAPSAGALYPVEVYVLVNSVEGVEPGIYHYSVVDHALEKVKKGRFAKKARKASLDQEMVEDSAIIFVLSAIFDRCRSKYGERGFRYTYMEAGHMSQNIYLQATSLNLGSVAMGAFLDDDWNELLGVDGKKETVIYLHAVGKVK